MLSQIEQLEKSQSQYSATLKRRIDDVERIQIEEKKAANNRSLARRQNFQEMQKQVKETKETLQSNLIGQTNFLQKKIMTVSYMMFFNLLIVIGILLYLIRGVFL